MLDSSIIPRFPDELELFTVQDSRGDTNIDRDAVRWMETIQSFAPSCPVILVLNKSDLNPNVTVNERTLKNLNPAYRHTIHTSAKRNMDPGVQQLKDSILREIPECLREMSGNRGFLGLKKELEDMEDDYLLPDQFQNLCKKNDIREDLRAGVLKWFQDLGVAYNYAAGLQRFYVLNPTWLTNGIYRLILRAPDGGFLQHSIILDILEQSYDGDISDKTYSPQEMEFILHVMRKFEISMCITPPYADVNVEMIPVKMRKTQPDRYDDFPKHGALHLRWEAGYLPNNLVHRLMIRKYQELDPEKNTSEKCVWQTGGWFRSVDGGCEALVEMTDCYLDVFVRGAYDARVYMDSFRQQILQILEDLHIKAKEYVYCTVNGNTDRIPYAHVMNIRKRGERRIYLGDIDEYISIDAILWENYLGKEMEIRDFFISYNNVHDKEISRWIADTLMENGYTVYFQAYDCIPGMSFPRWMAEAIDRSRNFLAVWSKAYEKSSYCQDELNAAYVRTHKENNYMLLPVRVEDAPVGNRLFSGVVRVDLLSSDENTKRTVLLDAVKKLRQA